MSSRAMGRIIKAPRRELTEAEKAELGAHVARAVVRALRTNPCAPSMGLIALQLERFEAQQFDLPELFLRLETTS